MKAVLLVAVVVGFLGSPLWTSALIVMLPRKLLALALGVCAIQGTLVYAIWWFFWGGGIGGEAHLSQAWQFAFGFALLPVITTAVRFWSPDAMARQGLHAVRQGETDSKSDQVSRKSGAGK